MSITIVPEYKSTSRNNDVNKEDFPEPVRPTIPIFSAGRVSKETPFKDGGRCSLKYFFLQKYSAIIDLRVKFVLKPFNQ